jgi:hypothetical protein
MEREIMFSEPIDPELTLAEAIIKLRAETGEADLTEAMAGQSTTAFDMHDAVHIVFGCDGSLPGEISAHVWMALATTAPLSEMHTAVASREHKFVLSGVGHLKLVKTWIGMIPKIALIFWRSRRMTSRLPYEGLPSLMSMSITDIRKAYRISPSV